MSVMDAGSAEQLYLRRLPGGGFVSIDVVPFRNLFGRRRYRGEVTVELRSDPNRRKGHHAPLVAVAEADSVADVLHELFPVAQSNTTLANAVVTHRRSVGR